MRFRYLNAPFVLFAAAVVALSAISLSAADWPMWRYDAGRTAASTEALPAQLVLRWTRENPRRVQVWDDPLNNDLMQYDKVFEPIVWGDRVLAGFNDSDKIVCWDLASGAEVWRFYTDGPVRFAPVAWNDHIYCVSDDGRLYCLNAADGSLHWQFRGGPSDRKVLGNRRIVSMWPARGGPVLRDGKVYFAASIWPFMGTFLYALDAESGRVEWVNDGTSSEYIKQPHSAPSFAGVAPQGALAATEDYLVVPGGRSIPAVFDRRTGKLLHFHLNAGGKGTGGALVIADNRHFYVHTRLRGVRKFDMLSGLKTEVTLNEPVLDGELRYTSSDEKVQAIAADDTVLWELPVDGRGDLIKAGHRLYAAGQAAITVIELPRSTAAATPNVAARLPVDGEVLRLVAGGDCLLAVTLDGRILAYGAPKPDGEAHVQTWKSTDDDAQPGTALAVTNANESVGESRRDDPGGALGTASDPVIEFLSTHDARDGYAFMFGANAKLLDELIAASELHIVAVDEDASLVDRLRRRYDDLGLYGKRVVLHQGAPRDFQAPPYVARLVAVGASDDAAGYLSRDQLQAMYASVRPYGGVLWFPLAANPSQVKAALADADLPQAKIADDATPVAVRVGALAGSAPWTHLYGNVANTVKSDDRLVKPPLGLLWFGGNSNMDVLPRHSHSPGEQVIGGRLFVEGMNSLSARDVYTGRVLWRREFPDLGTFGIYYDDTYKNTPLNPAYNQVHIPGANSRGTNYVATLDRVYLVIGNQCHVMDSKTGETLRVISLPADAAGRKANHWTYVGVYDDILLAGVDFADYTQQDLFAYASSLVRGAAWSSKWFASHGLVALDRFSGKQLWRLEARNSFLHNGIVAGNDTVFLLDKLPQSVEAHLTRRGRGKPAGYRILAVDARTGKPRWQRQQDVFGTWLGYSADKDILVQAGSAAPDRSKDEVGRGLLALRGADGSKLWQRSDVDYAGPCILHNETLITNSRSYRETSGVFSLLDGSPVLIENPLTGRPEPWTYSRAYGCNTAVASENLLTFRSGAAGYYDLNAKCGVGNLGGFRSGCSANLVVADGVLNAPDYTRTCSCGYQNQTSLALVHMPEVETWTTNPFPVDGGKGRIKHIGINFGAPGARRATDGAMWVEFPPIVAGSLPLGLEITGDDLAYYRRHASVAGGELPWVACSGANGVARVKLTLPTASDEDSANSQDKESSYTLRLHFAEPEEAVPGRRLFDVLVQGRLVLPDVDVLADAGAAWVGTSRTISGIVPSDGHVTIDFRPHQSGMRPILAGLEVIAE